jgi:hypothetical protein
MTSPTRLRGRALVLVTFVATALAAAPARADDRSTDYATSETSDGYGVTFRDDLLAGDGAGLSAPLVRVRPQGARNALIRLRTSFLSELRKSVEAL